MQGAEATRPDQRSWHPLTTLTNVAGEGCQAMPTHRTQPSRPGLVRQQNLRDVNRRYRAASLYRASLAQCASRRDPPSTRLIRCRCRDISPRSRVRCAQMRRRVIVAPTHPRVTQMNMSHHVESFRFHTLDEVTRRTVASYLRTADARAVDAAEAAEAAAASGSVHPGAAMARAMSSHREQMSASMKALSRKLSAQAVRDEVVGADASSLDDSSLRSQGFAMRERGATLKHFLQARSREIAREGSREMFLLRCLACCLQVVPTRWVTARGKRSDAYQYTAYYNEYQPPRRAASTDDDDHHRDVARQLLLPGVIFSYDVSPYRVVHTARRQGLAEFLTQLCAVIGGVFTVFGMLDGVVYNGIKAVKRD